MLSKIYKGAVPLVAFLGIVVGNPLLDLGDAKQRGYSSYRGSETKIMQVGKPPHSNLETLLGRAAYAEPIPSNEHKGYLEIDVTEYYEEATPRDDIMPGMRDMSFRDKWIIKSKYLGGNPITFKRGEFSKYYFGKKYGQDIKKIFEEGGVNIDKLTKFLNAHKNEKAVFLYGDGFMILFDDTERVAYILPIGKDVADKVFKL